MDISNIDRKINQKNKNYEKEKIKKYEEVSQKKFRE